MAAPKKHFKVERHPPNAWRIVNAHIGHGLIFKTRKQADTTCRVLNTEFNRWVKAGMETNPFKPRPQAEST